ncbi:unnamed protein product [Oppiella nova]|uniref:Fatty acid synthase n=1 Tax=Oppiella nova TaxID=334625 RepID=A0A7R9QP73_9ACAR|nr:unnamed protein product [Oppiella nova]CAG2169230.1 unnamed protein product [Oppiella nova]
MSDNDIVISGISGRFPLSDNTDELAKNLYDKVDMITGDDTRWPSDLYDLNPRMGKIMDFNKFDSTFFGLMEQMMNEVDPQARMLLEVVYEAIADAGINPQDLRGSRTGVYVGVSIYANTQGYPEDIQPDIRTNLQGTTLQFMSNTKTFYASRISFVFDFKGPSMIVDTACSASLSATTLAVNDMKLGNVDSAIVCGTHMVFEPFVLQFQQESGLCSQRGVAAVLDQDADGFVKGEAVCCTFLQRRRQARRVYATVLAAKMNIDGNKTIGMFFPSAEAQEELMIETYKEANVDPLDLTYFEAHCTGTKAGDPQELKAIYNAYCKGPGREAPLPLGALKSNIGHTEAGSGTAAIIKVCIAYENECIPANLNLTKIKDECAVYCPPLSPINDTLPYTPGLVGVNNFGLGGVNAHVLMKPNYKLVTNDGLRIAQTIPRIVNICGRTQQSAKP